MSYVCFYCLQSPCVAECPGCAIVCFSSCPCQRNGASFTADLNVVSRYERESCPDCSDTCSRAFFACMPHECSDYEDHFTIPVTSNDQ